MIRRTMAVLIPFVLLVACSSPSGSGGETPGGGGGESAGPGESAAPAESAAASVGGGGGGDSLATVDLTITGGDYAGTYQVEITSGGCSTGVLGPGTFAVASTEVDPAEAFQGAHITLYDADAAASGDDANFSAGFPFNNFAYTVEVNPKLGSGYGTGTATLDNRGSTATLTIEGTTSANEQVDATIECHTVTNF